MKTKMKMGQQRQLRHDPHHSRHPPQHPYGFAGCVVGGHHFNRNWRRRRAGHADAELGPQICGGAGHPWLARPR